MLKNTTPVICAMALAMALLSCAREVLEPGQMITGKYAPDDGSGLASEYISFDGGELGLYRSQSDVLFTFAENKFWDCSKSTFLTTIGYRYSIQSGMMSSGFYSGPAELTGDKLKLGTKTYTRLDGFEQEKYSSIEVESELTVPYNSGGTFTPLSISRPIAAGKISASASSSSSWITGVKVEDGELRFNYSETKNPRDGYITITYTNAQSRTITVHQRPSTYIVLPSAANTVDYTGKSVSIPYSITGPVAGSSLSAKCTATWVKNISVTSSAVECTVDENTGNTSRNATFTLSYSGAADVTYVLTQDWASTSVTTSPSSLSCDYAGGTFSFGVNVQNPRSGVVVAATSQVAWITDVSVAGNRVAYTVGENNSAVSRTGKIKLTYGSYATAEFSITQTGKLVHSITLNKTALPLHSGDAETLVATVDPSDAEISWSSSSTAVATVSTTGKVTAVGNGNAVITASATDGSGKKATCAVTVTTLATGVSLNKTSLVLDESGSETLTATITPSTASDKSVTWSSTNASVATVDQNGKVTAISKGTATITATTNDGSGKKATCAVTVKRLVSSISLNKTSVTIYTGETETLTATVLPDTADDRSISWSSSNTSIATVSSSGVVTAKAVGTATITATASDGSGKKATCSVTVKQYVTGVTLNKTSLSLNEGGSETLTATIAPSTASDKSVTWSSTNTSVVTVDQNGKVTAVSKGTATITATANDGSGKKATCAVTVKRLVSSISLNKTSITIYTGGTETLTVTVLPDTADDRSISWSSSNTSVATVNSSGKVTAVAAGTATITATAKDGSGKKASCAVTVRTVVDLSSSGTANCYIVTGAGFYKFKTVKGNSSTSVGTVSSVSVLWETFGTSTAVSVGDLVSNVSYENGYISFEASSKKGNALIAAKNSSGKILWSWHIWMTNKPADQTYRNSAGKMMDRNLGATSATAGDVKALGLLYQWGRKDPFLAGQTISSSTIAMSTLNSWTAVSVSSALAGNTSLNYSIENPTAFIYNGSAPYDWYCTSSSYQNNSLWSSSKSIYDPCPPGYQIPPGGGNGVWAKAAGSSTLPTWDSTSRGCDFGGVFTSSGSCWYPAPGQRGYASGSITSSSAGNGGYYWSYTANGSAIYELWIEISSGVNVKTQVTTKYRASGRSVRCIKI